VDSQSSIARIVGRERELGHLRTSLDALDGGSAACLTIEGEPGIGKTRLLNELRRQAEERGHVVLSGAAAEFEREMPFSVWVDALDAYVVAQGLTDHDGWDPDLGAELGRVLPSLRTSNGEAAAIADERYRTHRAVRRLLALIADGQPLVLVLDDLHWSDGASIELVSALIGREPEAPVLLALGFRPGQADERLSASVATPPVSRLQLNQLSEQEAAQLLDQVDAETVAAIYRHGGGNPFYLEQLGRASGEGLAAPLDGKGVEGGLPAAVKGAIAGELESLSPPSRAFLDAAAVAGEPFEPDLAAVIAELSQADALDALDDLLELDLIRPTEVPRRFAFRHPLVRRAVYESTRGGWRLGAHGRAADALAARGAAPAERAHHIEQSAGPGDQDAIELLLEAGQAAASRAPATAARWFEAALRLLPDAGAERQVEVRIALASALRSVGELDRCRATLLEATDLLDPAAVARKVELTTLCAAVEHWQGHHDDAHRRLTRTWDELADHDTPEAAALQIELGLDGMYRLDFDQAIEVGRAALDASRAVGNGGLVAAAAAALALAEAASGKDVDSARAHLGEALEQIERLSDNELARRLETLYYLGWAENYLELYDDAIQHAERGVEVARATGEGRLLIPLMLVRGYPYEMQGRLSECISMCETAVESARLSANPHYLSWALFELGWGHYFSGNLEAAIEACEESARVVGGRLKGGTMPSAGGGPGWALAVAWQEIGDTERAFELMQSLGHDLGHVPVERCFNWENVALAHLTMGHEEAAADCARQAEELSATLDLRLPAAIAARTRAAVLLAAGDAAGAAEAAAASAVALDMIGAALQAAFSRSLQGRALAVAEDRSQAIEVLREAERVFDECASVRPRDEARRELRKLGARAEARGKAAAGDSGIGALTGRELEIAELIKDRLTNTEIAAKLFLSQKTVESHIRNTFMKLGVSSRVEVARLVERERREHGN
jgi:ATP/maltotriose-dependent transcriptional regulator MalT